ncbi:MULTISPECIES: zinc ribbon domain-containing protein [unclassified Enterobacter]|jgi:predicted amidophosphoribosyltransferase|uniref:zinc ribbon domain-containing protein n=1 Tax=unclassified Enterobacter TaxID=2608935 RepID=UPI0015C8B700|nr:MULTISPECIES: zinc ribbon domain-containing protein [unclassified Enterobacter]MBB3304498.1 putative amidophosphoribosyltransferase [Enterobacter sp. Sphag1F]NYI12398.1 putative amidophosphoribosyltransferase [Enterobacter sp. Sphag71]
MNFSCPACQQLLTHNETGFNCPSCERHFALIALCPDCHQPLQVLKACGAVDYFCQHVDGLISKKRVEFIPDLTSQ